MKKVLMAFVFCLLFSVSVQAKTTLPTDKTTASEGCTLVGVEGEYITQAKEALRRINEIRKEACEEGVWKPVDDKAPTERLKPSDYKEIKWSSDLEYIARIRAAEATVVTEHTRPNGNRWSTLHAPNGQRSWGEVLAWNDDKTIVDGINQWYEEKKDWESQKAGAVTGHYTQMIDPDNTYVGLGAFYNPNAYYKNATAGEFSSNKEMDETQNTMSGECIQTIEVKESSLSLNLSLKKADIEAKEETQVKANVKASGCPVSVIGNITWSSSDNDVAKVDQNGKITGVDYGTATITAKSGTLSQSITVNVTTHDWNEQGEISKIPTCKETGEEIFKCKVCDTTKTESIPMTDHKERVRKEEKAATCTEAGYTGNIYCAYCNKLLEKGKEIPAIGHKWDEGKVTTEPGCEKKGVKTYTCTVCSGTKTESIPATGHKEGKIKDIKAATCETVGYTGNTYCAVCDKVIKKGKTIPATGHQWDAGKVTKVATYTETGITTYTCKACGTKRTETIKKLPMPKVGKVGTVYTVDGDQYKVTKEGKEVSLIQGSASVRSAKIPDTITVDNITYKVTEIAAKAFKKSKKLKTVTIGKNVRKINRNAFFKCSYLKIAKINTILLKKKTASKYSFKGAHKSLKLKVRLSVKKSYKKIFKGLKVE